MGKFAKKEARKYRERTRPVREFKDHIIEMIHNLGRDGVEYACEILFEVSRIALSNGCLVCRIQRICDALAIPEVSDAEL